MLFEFTNNMVYEVEHGNDLFMNAFLKNACIRPSCTKCNFKKVNRVSDITLADFWGIDNILPQMNDDKGISLMLIHSEKGQWLLEQLLKKIRIESVNISDALSFNKSATESRVANRDRKLFFENLENLPFEELVEKYSFYDWHMGNVIEENLELLQENKIYMYGAGKFAKRWSRMLEEYELALEGVVTTSPGKQDKFKQYQIQSIDEIGQKLANSVVIVAVSARFRDEILEKLVGRQIKKIIW